MKDLPRIETTNPDQALAVCRSLLSFVENVACEQKKTEVEQAFHVTTTPAEAWHGIQLIMLLVRNTLLHFELHTKEL